MKQVAVRMPKELHLSALKTARREKVSFGSLVRRAVEREIQTCVRLKVEKTAGLP